MDEEVQGPIYAYRVYRTESRNGFGTSRVLVPVHFKYLNKHGNPTSSNDISNVWRSTDGELTPIHVDLFDWHVSPNVPDLESPYHNWSTRTPNALCDIPGVEEWWPVATQNAYMSHLELDPKEAEEAAARERGVYYSGLRTGIHSFKKLEHAIAYARQNRIITRALNNSIPVIAKIEIGGVVVEHDEGYRSEKSRIVDLMMSAHKQARTAIAEQLGWPFEITVPEVRND